MVQSGKIELRESVLSALRSRDLESAHACATRLKEIEDSEHPEWAHRHLGRIQSVDHLKVVLSSRPQILETVSDDILEHLRFAAGVSLLLGVTRFRDYLPVGLKIGLLMDNDSAVRMLLFHASYEAEMALARLSHAQKVRLSAANWAADFSGVCDYCKSLHGKEWDIEEAPEIPLKHCTARSGCRCMVTPVLADGDKERSNFGL